MSDPNAASVFPSLVDQAIVLTGATASGKSGLALQLAERIGGEILSLDSIAVYREMDIGTAKPSAEDRSRVPHHLLDLTDPDQDFSVACYLEAAHRCVQQVRARGKRPIFVGGTPMYLKAVLRGFDPGPPPDWDFRQAVERDVERHGVEALRERLRQVDPLSAARIAPGDTRRMIRALEVSTKTGIPLSHRQIQFEQFSNAESCNVFVLRWPRTTLHERINRRVATMFQRGLIAEVRGLRERYGTLSRTARQAVGYRELLAWLDQGQPAERREEVVESVAAHTRQLARRQETWFRSFAEITPVDIEQESEWPMLLERLLEHLQRAGQQRAGQQRAALDR